MIEGNCQRFFEFSLQNLVTHNINKVQIFSEGHKNLKKSPILFDITKQFSNKVKRCLNIDT